SSGWPVKSIPLQVNVVQHPLPTARRCLKLGQALRKAVESYGDARVVVLGTGGMSHQLQGKRFGFMNEKFDQWFMDELEKNPEGRAEISHERMGGEGGGGAVELILGPPMGGAVPPKAKRFHRHYYAPMTTGMGLISFEG